MTKSTLCRNISPHTEPGPFRDSLLTHWYRGKMLGRVGGVSFGRRDEALSRRLVETIRVLALERYDEAVHDRLAFNLQVRSALLREGRYESLRRLAEFESALRAKLKVRVRGDGEQLALRLTATLGSPGELDFLHEGERMLWRPPEPLRDALAGADLDVTEALRTSHVQVFLRSLRDGSDYLVPSDTELSLGGPGAAVRPRLEARVDIQAADGAAGAPLPAGDWEVHAHVSVAGFSDARPLRRNGAPLVLRSSSPGRVVARWAVLPRPLLARRLAARVPLGSQARSRQQTSVS